MDAYERIARMIRYLDEHYADQPGLAELARQAGLSPYHFHRLFVSWAGVTPKDFLQCLTLAHMKQALRNGRSVLDASFDTGLSGPGRAHDLCLSLESASPGEMKSGGAHWTLDAGFSPSPFGTCLVAHGPRGICHLSFVEHGREANAWAELRADWPRARLRRNNAGAARLTAQIFSSPAHWNASPSVDAGNFQKTNGHLRDAPFLASPSTMTASLARDRAARPRPQSAGLEPERPATPLRAFVRGTSFQVRVWRALLRVPPGQLISYGQLAESAGCPAAARAVGTAVAHNPLAWLIPCHRVIRETGVLGNYRWGRVRKQAMVAWETARERSMRGRTAANLHRRRQSHHGPKHEMESLFEVLPGNFPFAGAVRIMPHRLFNLEEVARYLHLTQQDVSRRVKDHAIPFETRGSRIVFRKAEIDAWASQRILALSKNPLAEYHRESTGGSHESRAQEAILPELLDRGALDSAMTSKTKASVLRDLVKLAEKTNQVSDPRDLLESLESRERLGSTAVPGGLALPHPRFHQPYLFTSSFLVVGRVVQEIHFGAPDGQPTTLFILICCQDGRFHLHTLARLCLMALTTDVLAQVRQAPDAETMYACLIAAEQEVLVRRKSRSSI